MSVKPLTDKSLMHNFIFWDNWIGQCTFTMNYLQTIFSDNRTVTLVYYKGDTMIGILMYKKMGVTNKYKILLLAKKDGSKEKGIGRAFFLYLGIILKGNIIILSDDTDIPNYYTNLEFTQIPRWNRYYYWLLNDYVRIGYYKYLNINNI